MTFLALHCEINCIKEFARKAGKKVTLLQFRFIACYVEVSALSSVVVIYNEFFDKNYVVQERYGPFFLRESLLLLDYTRDPCVCTTM